jgi:hypothetical protein
MILLISLHHTHQEVLEATGKVLTEWVWLAEVSDNEHSEAIIILISNLVSWRKKWDCTNFLV